MLVLTRKESEKILFPSLGISVEVLRVRGNKTQLGIDAPVDVPILRHEIADLKAIEFAPSKQTNDNRLRDLVHTIRARLDAAAVDLNQLNHLLDGQPEQQAQTLIHELFGELRKLESEANQVLDESGVPVNETPQALLVEDSATERKLLESYLELSGFNVTTAEDGQEALDYLSLHARPDVVLLDMMMPRIDGAAFVRTVRADPKLRGLTIFALSGLEQKAVNIPAGDGGVDRWYLKPVNPKQLVADVATHLTNTPMLVA